MNAAAELTARIDRRADQTTGGLAPGRLRNSRRCNAYLAPLISTPRPQDAARIDDARALMEQPALPARALRPGR